MRRFFVSLILLFSTLLIALPACGAMAESGMTVLSCPEGNFATRVDFDCRTEYVSGDGLYIMLTEDHRMPYVLVSVDYSDSRVTDAFRQLSEEVAVGLQDANSANGSTMSSVHELGRVGGKTMPVLEMQYHNDQGAKIWFIAAFDVREDCTVYYRARYYREEDEQATLRALDTVAENLLPGADAHGEAPAASAGGMTELSCAQQRFTTLADFECVAEEKEGNGLFIYLDEAGFFPYFQIFLNDGDTRVLDGEAYLSDVAIPNFRERFGANGSMMFSQSDDFTIAGRYMPNVELQFRNNSGVKVYGWTLFDVRDGYTVTYRARYDDPQQRQRMFDALETLVSNLSYSGAGATQGAPLSQNGKAADPEPLQGFTVTRAESIVPATYSYSSPAFTATLPVGWKVVTGGLMQNYAIKCYDPSQPARCLFFYGELGSWHKSQEGKDWWINYPAPYNPRKPMIDEAPVLPRPTMGSVVENWDAFCDYVQTIYPLHLAVEALSPDVMADIRQAQVLETSSGPAFEAYRQAISQLTPMNGYPDASINRFTCFTSDGTPCEGAMGGIILDCADPNKLINPTLPDRWFYYANCVIGYTAPMGELQELAPTLIECVTSLRFTDSYIQQSNQQGQVLASIIASRDTYLSSWESRERSYDILSQKYSDATLGYDRLYDSETGEVYRADLDFYDSYDLHRDEYSNPNLLRIDDSTRQYYLQGVDYYITR